MVAVPESNRASNLPLCFLLHVPAWVFSWLPSIMDYNMCWNKPFSSPKLLFLRIFYYSTWGKLRTLWGGKGDDVKGGGRNRKAEFVIGWETRKGSCQFQRGRVRSGRAASADQDSLMSVWGAGGQDIWWEGAEFWAGFLRRNILLR